MSKRVDKVRMPLSPVGDGGAGSNPLVLDKNAFFRNFEGLKDVAVTVIDMFLSQEPDLLRAIDQAIQSQDSKRLELAAHTLKGAVSNFYAESTKLLAWELEQMGHSGKMDQAQTVFLSLQGEALKLCIALKEIRDEKNAA